MKHEKDHMNLLIFDEDLLDQMISLHHGMKFFYNHLNSKPKQHIQYIKYSKNFLFTNIDLSALPLNTVRSLTVNDKTPS